MTKKIAAIIKKEFKRLNLLLLVIMGVSVLLLAAIYVLAYVVVLQAEVIDWLPGLVIVALLVIITDIIIYAVVDSRGKQTEKAVSSSLESNLRQLRSAYSRAKSLQSMASVMRATLSFERVVEEALNVSTLSIEEMGVPRHSLVGAVFLYHGRDLVPVATRRFPNLDEGKTIKGQQGMVGDALNNAEITISDVPRQDPELRAFVAFQNCAAAACIPLRAGFQIFGAMVIGSQTALKFEQEQFELFAAVADQAVIALQNAQLYQKLEAEKQRIIEADEDARKELARDLHDGPTQSIAAIAMRINFIRSLMTKNPGQVLLELEKVEQLAKQTSKDIRGMLFTLRPLVLETQGLTAAVETVITRLKENDGLNIRLSGGEYGELLTESAQSVVFSIVEEALGNARKYSEADLILVRFWQEENLFVALVQDNGNGFDVQEVNTDYSSRGSLGMINMRERADRIDGSLKLDSVIGKGTKVTLVVPLDKHGRRVKVR
ncbi:MAG: GAF domain-containing sensor histidine kinase [Chloroflexi bacterium]|nr:GAF domain-containing sensor histidine kinase [Chloroflexota bacterium]